MEKLVTQDKIRKLESDWIKLNGPSSSLKLMEKAGFALAEVLNEYKEPYLIICGKGNNGGDGIVAAKYLIKNNKKVVLCLTSDELELSEDAKINFKEIKDKLTYFEIQNRNLEKLEVALKEANTIIDCLLGTGTNKKPNQFFEEIVKSINQSNKDIIACDIPTGIDPDSGNLNFFSAVKAKLTVTFSYTKLGLVIYPAKKYVGKIKTIDIGLPDIETNYFLLDDNFVRENFPTRAQDANKGTFGKTLLVCGSKRFPGAALLASKAAASIGSGLTLLTSTSEVLNQIAPVTPEVIHVEFNTSKILEESLSSTSIVIGPGLGQEDEIKNLVETLIKKVNVSIVLDADGINVLSNKKEIILHAKKHIILTPHPKELARLLNITTEEVLNNKLEIAQQTAKELNCTLILKGAGTIIATKEGKIYISPFANPALAKGGTGDVLSGFIGGLISQGLESTLAACVGVYVHGKVGEIVANEKTVFSLLPQDLITYLPKVLKDYTT